MDELLELLADAEAAAARGESTAAIDSVISQSTGGRIQDLRSLRLASFFSSPLPTVAADVTRVAVDIPASPLDGLFRDAKASLEGGGDAAEIDKVVSLSTDGAITNINDLAREVQRRQTVAAGSDPLLSGIRTGINSALLGFGDEILGALEGAKAVFPGGLSPREAARLKIAEVRGRIDGAREVNPTASLVGDIAGGASSLLLGGAGAGRAAVAGARALGLTAGRGAQPVARALGAAVGGAAEGGLFGIGIAEGSLAERLPEARLPAAVGALGGLAGAALTRTATGAVTRRPRGIFEVAEDVEEVLPRLGAPSTPSPVEAAPILRSAREALREGPKKIKKTLTAITDSDQKDVFKRGVFNGLVQQVEGKTPLEVTKFLSSRSSLQVLKEIIPDAKEFERATRPLRDAQTQATAQAALRRIAEITFIGGIVRGGFNIVGGE